MVGGLQITDVDLYQTVHEVDLLLLMVWLHGLVHSKDKNINLIVDPGYFSLVETFY
jgi:hypothetical protein